MTAKVFVVLAFVYFLQKAEGNYIFGITNATRRRIAETEAEVIQARRESTVEVNAIENLLERYVEIALKPANKDLKAFKCKIRKAETKANEDGYDISSCGNDARKNITKLDVEEVRDCILANDNNIGASLEPKENVRAKEIILAQRKLDAFRGLLYALRESPNTCANKGMLANRCVEVIINASREKILILQNEISVILRHTNPEVEGLCISKQVKKLQDQLEAIKGDWNKCVKNLEPPEKETSAEKESEP